MYSFKDILELFDINENKITVDEIKRAKKTVLMTHPDKSKLESKYFLFFKKAFDVLYNFYENNLKQTVDLTNIDTDYKDYHNEEDNTKFKEQIQKTEKKTFNSKFNKLFEQNANINKIDKSKNQWFENEETDFEENEKIVNVSSMNSAIDRFKQKNSALIVHRDIQEMRNNNGANLYEEDNNDYVGSDIFGKFKYDDLRKVHKDQTVFNVSEKDINKVKQYNSLDEYKNVRGNQSLDPMEKRNAELIMKEKEKKHTEMMHKKQHKAYLQTMQNEENNKKFMAGFLQIK